MEDFELGYTLPRVIRAERTSLYATYGIVAVILCLAVPDISRDVNALYTIVVMLGVAAWATLAIEAQRIVLDKEGIAYRSLLEKMRKVRYADIARLEVSVGTYSPMGRGNSTLTVVPIPGRSPLRINMKLFRKVDLYSICSVIRQQNREVLFDRISTELLHENIRPLEKASVNATISNSIVAGIFHLLVTLFVSGAALALIVRFFHH